jgi:thioredoxin-related protein
MRNDLNLRKLWAILLFALFAAISASPVYAQKIRWMKFEEAYAASQKSPRKIFAVIYTDNCKPCKMLNSETFSDTGMIRILNEQYYPVKLNPESKEKHTVGDNKFSSQELAATLTMTTQDETVELPAMVILNENMQMNELIKGFQKPDYLKEKLSFFAFGKTANVKKPASVKWMKFEDAIAALEKEPRKIFVDIYADWCGWCKVLDKNTFSDADVAKILNEQFYPVKMDAESKNVLTVNGTKMTESELAASLAATKEGERYSLPTMIVLSEQPAVLTRIQGAQKPDFMIPALLFFSKNHYIDKTWETYIQEYAAGGNK